MMLRTLAAALLLCLLAPLPSLAAPAAGVTVTAQPAARGTVPQGAQRVPFLTLSFRASCAGPVTVSELVLRHAGLGAAEDLARAYVMVERRRVTRAVSVPSGEDFTLRMRGFSLPACATADLTVFADLSPDAAVVAEHRLELQGVTATAPVAIESAVASSSAAPLSVTPNPSSSLITVEMREVTSDVSYGGGRVVARLALTTSGKRQQRLRAITLTNDGSARDGDLKNLYLETSGGDQLTLAVDQLTDHEARLEFDPPLVLERSETRLFILRADVRGSRSRTIRFEVEEPSDVEAEEVRGR